MSRWAFQQVVTPTPAVPRDVFPREESVTSTHMLEQGIRAPGESDRDSEPIKVFRALFKNFTNAENAARVRRVILSNGFPTDIAGWIFATLTIRPVTLSGP